MKTGAKEKMQREAAGLEDGRRAMSRGVRPGEAKGWSPAWWTRVTDTVTRWRRTQHLHTLPFLKCLGYIWGFG